MKTQKKVGLLVVYLYEAYSHEVARFVDGRVGCCGRDYLRCCHSSLKHVCIGGCGGRRKEGKCVGPMPTRPLGESINIPKRVIADGQSRWGYCWVPVPEWSNVTVVHILYNRRDGATCPNVAGPRTTNHCL